MAYQRRILIMIVKNFQGTRNYYCSSLSSSSSSRSRSRSRSSNFYGMLAAELRRELYELPLPPGTVLCSSCSTFLCYCRKAKRKLYKLATTRPLPSVCKFNKLLDHVFSHLHDYHLSATLFYRMCRFGGLPVNHHTANIAFNSYLELGFTAFLAFPALAFSLKKGAILLPTTTIFNTILRGFVREHHLTMEAERLFKTLFRDHHYDPDVITFNAIIGGLCNIGNHFTSVGLLRLMDARGGACKPDIVTYNTLIDSFCKDIMIDDASNLFTEMVSGKNNILPDVHTYNSLIYAFSKKGHWDEVTRMLKQMEELKICLNKKTFHILIEALCKQGKIKEAKDVIDIMVERGLYPDIVIFNSLIDGYSLLGDMAEARNTFDLLFHRGVKPNVATYNKVMDGYCKNFMPDAAHDLFYHITLEGIETNDVTHCILHLASLAESELEERYRQFLTMENFEGSFALFQHMDDNKFNSHIDVYNILIHGATKCSEFDTARRLFHDLIVKGLKPQSKTYTAMISCLCKGGLLKDAKQLLLKMEKSGCRPPNYDETINDILQAYLEFKPFDDVVKFCLTVQQIPFSLNNLNASILLDQILLRNPHNTSLLSWVNKVKLCSHSR